MEWLGKACARSIASPSPATPGGLAPAWCLTPRHQCRYGLGTNELRGPPPLRRRRARAGANADELIGARERLAPLAQLSRARSSCRMASTSRRSPRVMGEGCLQSCRTEGPSSDRVAATHVDRGRARTRPLENHPRCWCCIVALGLACGSGGGTPSGHPAPKAEANRTALVFIAPSAWRVPMPRQAGRSTMMPQPACSEDRVPSRAASR
jgi:hypothetical protein